MRFLVLALLSVGLGACGNQPSSDTTGDYQVKVFNLVTEKTLESRYESLRERAEGYRITGNLTVSQETISSGNGILVLQFSETSGFADIGDRPQFASVPITNGKGELKIELQNFSIPIDKVTVPPKIVFKNSFFNRLSTVVQRDNLSEDSGTQSEPIIVLRQKPITVSIKKSGIGDGSYIGNEEVSIEAAGALRNKSFVIWAVKTTLEHPDPTKIGGSEIVSLIVLEGSVQTRDDIYLGLVKEFDSNAGKSMKRPVPNPPKYKYEALGVREGGLVKVTSQ
jgi:hypothetical protein